MLMFRGIKTGKTCNDCKRFFDDKEADELENICPCGGRLI